MKTPPLRYPNICTVPPSLTHLNKVLTNIKTLFKCVFFYFHLISNAALVYHRRATSIDMKGERHLMNRPQRIKKISQIFTESSDPPNLEKSDHPKNKNTASTPISQTDTLPLKDRLDITPDLIITSTILHESRHTDQNPYIRSNKSCCTRKAKNSSPTTNE